MGGIPNPSANTVSAMASVLPSDPDEDTSFKKMNPIQKLIITTLGISPHLYEHSPQVNVRLAYVKYLGVLDTFTSIAKLIGSGTWPQKKKPTNDDMIEIFMSKSAWFQNHSKIFPLVNRSPKIEKWLQTADDAPSDYEVWGYQKQTFDNLLSMLAALPDSTETKKEKGQGKGKGKEKAVSGAESSDAALKKKKKKGAEKAVDKGKKKDNMKASTSKAHRGNK
jgi:hypothetical protein